MACTGFYASDSINNVTPVVDTNTTGTITKSGISSGISPGSDSTAVYFGHKSEMVWRSDNSLLAPGWITGHESVVSLTGAGNIFKVVGNMSQFNNLLAGGTASNVLGYEAVISYMDPAAHVQNYCGYYVPNQSIVPNIGNIVNHSAFQSDYTESKNSWLHPSYGAARQDLSPAERMAPVPGRFYTAEHSGTSAANNVANRTYFMPVHMGGRFNITKVGLQTGASAGAKAKLALYSTQGLNANSLIADFGEVDISAGGAVEITVNQRVEVGSYYLAVKTNQVVNMVFHTVSTGLRQAQYGLSSPVGSGEVNRIDDTSTYAAAFPSTCVFTTVATAGEPHLWYRMGV